MSKHKFRIEIELDSDKSSLRSSDVILYLDDMALGLVQKVEFEANVTDFIGKLKLTYPSIDVFDSAITGDYQGLDINTKNWYIETLQTMQKLKEIGVETCHDYGGKYYNDGGIVFKVHENDTEITITDGESSKTVIIPKKKKLPIPKYEP